MRTKWALFLAAAAVATISVFVSAPADAQPRETAPPHVLKTRGASGDALIRRGGGNGISYHNGPIMTGTTNAYIVWYGPWAADNPGAQPIVTSFLSSVGGSPYYNINTTYTDGLLGRVANSVTLAGQTTDVGSQGTSNLSDAAIQNVVLKAVGNGSLPSDAHGVYFVLTSKSVSKSGFLTSYCGWHTYTTSGSTALKYSFVGDATGPNLSSCAGQTTSSPNGNPGGDAMVSVIAHELEETATDPQLNAWYDTRGYENADKCAWTFGTTYVAANGSTANMKLGGRDFLIQRNWVNASGGSCQLKY